MLNLSFRGSLIPQYVSLPLGLVELEDEFVDDKISLLWDLAELVPL